MPTISSLRLTTRSFLAAEEPGLLVLQATEADPGARMRAEVLSGLASTPPTISPTYLYDAEGSALYERITALPEYYPTRTEDALLSRLAPTLAERAPATRLLELGSGSSTKTRRLIEAYLARRGALTYIPVDVSEGMLARSARDLTAAYPDLSVLGLAGRFEDAFAALEPQADTLAIFLGGTLGNFPP
ncbi:MAG: L-histidine N(alpha)-methyltransferase, partial [Candidatus Sericytochromatia bacterium]